MGAGFRNNLRPGSGLGKIQFGDLRNLDSLSLAKSVISATTKARMSPPTTPDVLSSNQSRHTSTDYTSEVAQEIVVWTEEMDIDDGSQHESEDSLDWDAHEE